MVGKDLYIIKSPKIGHQVKNNVIHFTTQLTHEKIWLIWEWMKGGLWVWTQKVAFLFCLPLPKP
jgi:hypothetical protein